MGLSCPVAYCQNINDMKKRVFENWKTTTIGLVLLTGLCYCFYTKLITFDQFMIALPTVFGLIWVKDTVLKP